jgi:hypothetical protein
MWIAFCPSQRRYFGHHPGQPVAVALYGAVCAITCLSSSVLRWYVSFGDRLINKEIGETKLRRDLRVSLYSCLFYLAGMAAGLFFPWLGLCFYAGIPASYAISELLGRKGHGVAR